MEAEHNYRIILRDAKQALAKNERARARRLARMAVKLAPQSEESWLFLAAVSQPRAGLAYVARALELNPQSRPARKAIRWLVQRLPSPERKEAIREAHLPEDMVPTLAPWEALTLHRPFSTRILLSALVFVVGGGIWVGNQPADAHRAQMMSGAVAKASFTPTPTETPTSTPTPTPTETPTPTYTPTVTSTPTKRPAVSWTYSTDPNELADEGRWIDVDLSAQQVTAYEGATPVQTFIVSTGKSRYPTVKGQFKIYIKLRSTAMSGPGYYLPGVPFTMYFYRGYSLHGTYWHDNFGTPMSHGCVNMRTPEAEWLFNFASIGTLVNVHP